MKLHRRCFIKTSMGGMLLPLTSGKTIQSALSKPNSAELIKAAEKPVLKKEFFSSPVKIASIDLLINQNQYIVRAESTDGAIGHAVSNNARMKFLYPILIQRVIPYFIGKDARELDSLIDRIFVYQSNYKLQGLAFWVCVASVEFALLDLLGQISVQSVGNLVGKITRKNIHMYRASGNRGNTAEQEVKVLQKLVKDTGAKAIKFKVGGRMSKDADSLPGRSEKLIPLAREVLGDDITIYVDSNGSYGVEKSIEIGRLCEKNNIGFFEEPCPFDHLWETKKIADALTVPIAGGEQESSQRRFRWMINNNAVQIVQPDLFYYGGFVRAIRVARMAEEAGMICIPHMSGTTLGYLYVLHFASCVPNAGKYMEYKGKNDRIPYTCDTSTLECKNGIVRVPAGPGLGIKIDPEFIKNSDKVKS